ncbi:hypothetical protein CGRA01v4_09790 [Colletotrichum graminicola]|uniref:Uncharacterized protein n=1 Tax=Colletotrichum graminicola (strain M1.001 / M2 / FGSC 10212) TaxID=645133 RepID=E3QTJ8_COLGM|nr:uncharacterized protein GLRG_09330 [Colletotrichum graminicola M1.001]EFQ34186.1 hypothetical protein GLRG_09330 [Colletotrichum graminicola M1.001]WDK18505.1 hypothetical protein CGRA01v4_09790 [Colletotrichum graminicola]
MGEVGQSSWQLPPLVPDDPPPPYSKEDDSHELSPDSPGRVCGASVFHQNLNGYGWKTLSGGSYYELGASREELRFGVCVKCILSARSEYLHIHDGLEPENDILANMSRNFEATPYGGKEQEVFNLTLHAVEGPREAEEQVEMYQLRDSEWGHRNTLDLVIDIGGRSERFQWRHSKGKEVKGLAGCSSGWKLVRLGSQEVGVGGKRKSREYGFTIDGKEVVAVIAQPLSFKRDFMFAFLGSGRSGALGNAWETAALMSGIWRWWNSVNASPD